VEEYIASLRLKLAHKHYESGRQYLKWRRTSSARLYFEMVLTQFYDTPYTDEARVGIIISYILDEDLDAAEAYHTSELDKVTDKILWEEARDYIERAKENKFDLAFLKRLYR